MPYSPVVFKEAHLKIERATEHMLEFDALAVKLFGRDFAPYTESSEIDVESGEYAVKFSASYELPRFAILAGEAIHSLRTALDFAWYELTSIDSLSPKDKFSFPIFPARKHLEEFIKGREKQDSVVRMSRKLLDTIQPYKGGNVIGSLIYALHQLDILDKHKLLIPHVQISHVWNEATEDGAEEKVVYAPNLINTFGTKDKNQGLLSASIVFGEGAVPVEGSSVRKTLDEFKMAVNITLLILGNRI